MGSSLRSSWPCAVPGPSATRSASRQASIESELSFRPALPHNRLCKGNRDSVRVRGGICPSALNSETPQRWSMPAWALTSAGDDWIAIAGSTRGDRLKSYLLPHKPAHGLGEIPIVARSNNGRIRDTAKNRDPPREAGGRNGTARARSGMSYAAAAHCIASACCNNPPRAGRSNRAGMSPDRDKDDSFR
jgi:hypothetical protein